MGCQTDCHEENLKFFSLYMADTPTNVAVPPGRTSRTANTKRKESTSMIHNEFDGIEAQLRAARLAFLIVFIGIDTAVTLLAPVVLHYWH